MENIISYAEEAVNFKKKIIFNAGIESSFRYYEPTKEYAPRISILVSPFGLPFVPIEIVGTNVGKIVSSMSWNKDRNNPGGFLSFSLAPDKKMIEEIYRILRKFPGGGLYSTIWNKLGFDLEDLFKPMALCQLWIDGYHVMTGTVMSCRRSSTVSNDSYNAVYTVSINELGNLYTKNTLRLDTLAMKDGLNAHIKDCVTKALDLSANIKGVTVQDGMNMLIKAFKASTFLEQGMNLSDGLPLALRLIAEASPIGAMALTCYARNMFVNINLMQLNQQSFWDFLKNFIMLPWMEFFTESGGRTIVTETTAIPAVLLPGMNYVVSRSTPYTNPMIGIPNPVHAAALAPFNLTILHLLAGGDFVIITDDDIIDKNIGTDCSTQATVFRTTYSADGNLTPGGTKPLQSIGPLNPFASGGMQTFGFNEMRETVNCTQLFDFGTIEQVAGITVRDKVSIPGQFSVPAWNNLLAIWYRNQCRFREGSVTTRMLPWARPGMACLYLPTHKTNRIENQRDIGLYYIDSLSHEYSLADSTPSATTTLNLIRGCPLPTSVAQTALLLFDFEILPPTSGLWDGEFSTLFKIRRGLNGNGTY